MAAACEVEPRRGLQEGYVGLFLSFKKQEATNKEQDTHKHKHARTLAHLHTRTLTATWHKTRTKILGGGMLAKS